MSDDLVRTIWIGAGAFVIYAVGYAHALLTVWWKKRADAYQTRQIRRSMSASGRGTRASN